MFSNNYSENITSTNIVLDNKFTIEEDELNDYTVYVLEIFTNCVMINIICVFGIIGNSINILVLCKHGFLETTNIILGSLSISDLICSIILPVTRLKYLARHFSEGLAISLNTFVTVYLFMPKYVCLAVSFSYVTVIAIERFVAVFLPFTVSRIFNTTTTMILVIVIPASSIILLIPTFLALTFTWTFHSRLNQTVAVIEYTRFYLDHQIFLDFYAWVGLNNFFGVSSNVVISVCCIAIVWKLSRAAVRRDLMTSGKAGYDVRVVKMLVTVCVVFLAVSIPNVALYSYFVPNFIFVSSLHELVDNICVVLYAVNASANFLIYVTMSKKFARTYKSLFTFKKNVLDTAVCLSAKK